jgi:hypothetical protein
MIFYSQRDPRWAKKPLSPSRETMGRIGCATTAIAFQIARELKRDVTPEELRAFLVVNSGYTAPSKTDPTGGLLKWDRISVFTNGRLRYLGRGATPPAGKKYTLVEVIYGTMRHWLALMGGGQCCDPWTGSQQTVATGPWRLTGERRYFG